MTVPAAVVAPELTLETIQAELVALTAYVQAAGLELDTSELTLDAPLVYVGLFNADAERFVAELHCRDYGMLPPTIEFVDSTPREAREANRQMVRALPRLYPTGFHGMPCVCMRYNRKAYGALGGPHGEWRMVDWRLPTGSGVSISNLSEIVSDLHSKIASSRGRMG